MTLKEEVELLREKVKLMERVKELCDEWNRNLPIYYPTYPSYPTTPTYPLITWSWTTTGAKRPMVYTQNT